MPIKVTLPTPVATAINSPNNYISVDEFMMQEILKVLVLLGLTINN
jgi:hypothetical protein